MLVVVFSWSWSFVLVLVLSSHRVRSITMPLMTPPPPSRPVAVVRFGYAKAFVIGAISRAAATVIVFPYIRAKVIIMSRKAGGGDEGGNSTTPSILGSLVTILKDDGVSALFQVLCVSECSRMQ